jgi:hypothetical protein
VTYGDLARYWIHPFFLYRLDIARRRFGIASAIRTASVLLASAILELGLRRSLDARPLPEVAITELICLPWRTIRTMLRSVRR